MTLIRSAPKTLFLLTLALSAVVVRADALKRNRGHRAGCENTLRFGMDAAHDLVGKIQAGFRPFRVVRLPQESGILLRLEKPKPNLPEREVTLFNNNHAERLEVWKLGEEHFQFLNVGFKNHETESMELNRVVAGHVLNFPQQDLRILFGPERVRVDTLLANYRWTVHNEVIKKYRKKHYCPVRFPLSIRLSGM